MSVISCSELAKKSPGEKDALEEKFQALSEEKWEEKEIFIEKHVKLKNSKGPDASSSIDTNELKLLVTQIRKIEKTNI